MEHEKQTKYSIRWAVGGSEEGAAQTKESVVFGDPHAPLTVGDFVHWLDAYFVPHVERDDQQTDAIGKLNVAIMGNGRPEESIQHKVNEVWSVMQRADAYMKLAKYLWITIIGLASAIVYFLTIKSALGF